jgi:YbgC/YbaW family acyl-CoA thioester hydrolase
MVGTGYSLTSERHVYIGDDDASGLIYFNSYFQYMSEADQDFFRTVGHPLVESIRNSVSCPCVKAECSYMRPVRAGDDITQITKLESPGRSSFRMVHRFYLEGNLAAEGVISRVWTDLTAMTSVPLPQWLRDLSSPSEK